MNPQNGQTPLDYLNQIAPETPKSSPFKLSLKTVIFGAIILVILVCIVAMVLSGVANARKQPWQKLSARLTTTQTISEDSTKKLKSSQIRSINSDLKLYLTNTKRDVAAPLGRADVDVAKLPASVVTQENGSAITERLEDARLNAKFDSTYAREMSYQLATLLALYQELYSSTGNTETKTFLKASYDNLSPIQKEFADYSAANE